MNSQENCVFLAFRIADAREEMAEGAKYSFEIYVCRVYSHAVSQSRSTPIPSDVCHCLAST